MPYTVDEFASELKARYPDTYAQLSNEEAVQKAIAKKPEIQSQIIQEPTNKFTVSSFATELKNRYPDTYSRLSDEEAVQKAISKKPELKNVIEFDKPSLIEKGIRLAKKGLSKADQAIRSFVDENQPGQAQEIEDLKSKFKETFTPAPNEPNQVELAPQETKEPISFGVTRNFEKSSDVDATTSAAKNLEIPDQIPLPKQSDAEDPELANLENRFYQASDPEIKATTLASLPMDKGIELLKSVSEDEKIKVEEHLEKIAKDRNSGLNAFAIGLLNSTPIPTFFPDETKEHLREVQLDAPIMNTAGQITGTISQAMLGGTAVKSLLNKVPVLAKSPLVVNVLTRLGVSGAIAAEQNIGRKDFTEALKDVVQQSGGGALSIVPEIVFPAGVSQVIAQPLTDLIYDVASGKIRGEEIGSKDWWINEAVSLASSLGFAIKDATSGKSFKNEQDIYRKEIKDFLSKNKDAKIEFTMPKERDAKLTAMVRENIAQTQSPAKSNIIEPEQAEFQTETLPNGMEVTRNVRQPPTEADLKMTVAKEGESPYINKSGEEALNEPPIEQKPQLPAEDVQEPRDEALRANEAQEPSDTPQSKGDRGQDTWAYGETKPEIESALSETSPETFDNAIDQKVSDEIDRLNFQSEEMQKIDEQMGSKFQSVRESEKMASQRGSIWLPGEKKNAEISGGEQKVAETLEAGRFQSLNPVQKIKDSISGIANSIKQNFTKFEADVEKFPQYKDDKRTQSIPMRRNIFDLTAKYRHASLAPLYKAEGKKGLRRATDILLLRNLKLRGEKGQTLENNLTVKEVSKHLDWLEKTSSPEVMQSVEDIKTILRGIGEELVARNKLSAESLEEDYFPHKVLDYLPDFMRGLKTPMNRKFGEPYRPYTRKALGSKWLIASDDSVIWTHIAKVLADNAQEDWFAKQALKYDATTKISPEEQKKFYKGYETLIDGKRYKVLEWKKVRYKAKALNESTMADALRSDMLVRDWLQTKTATGKDPVKDILVSGKPKMYLLPKEIAVDLDNMIEKSPAIFDLLYRVGHLTQKWKGFTLTSAMLPYQFGNIIGDNIMAGLYDPQAFGYMPMAVKVAQKIFYPNSKMKLNAAEQKLYDTALAKDVASSGMSSELRFSAPGKLLNIYNKASEFRESLARLSILAHQLDRISQGKSVQNLAGIDLTGLDPESAAGKVSREALVDYTAVPRSYTLFLSRGLLPFVRFHEGTFRNMARAVTRNKGTHKALATVAPIVASYAAQWAYNNLQEDKKELEMQLPDYIRNRWHIILGKNDKGNIVVWAAQQPVDMAMSWLGLDNMNRIASDLVDGRITPKQAAKEFIKAFRTGATENIESLLNPIIQMWTGLKTNKDPFSNRKIMPDKIHEDGIFSEHGAKYSIGYMAEKIFSPIMQYNKAKRGTEPDQHPLYDWILKGPLNLKRALGFYEIDPSTQKLAQHHKVESKIAANDAYYKRRFQNIIDKYGQDVAEALKTKSEPTKILSETQQQALKKLNSLEQSAIDNGFSSLEYGKWLSNIWTQQKIIDAELRKTSDPKKRKELKGRKEELRNASGAQYIKQVPKTAREYYISEMEKRKALPGGTK